MLSASISKYSIYPSNAVRVLVHGVFWILMILFFVFIESSLFRAKPFELSILLFSVYCIPVIIINHYILINVFGGSSFKIKWWKGSLAIIFIYCLSLSSIPFLGYLSELLPENRFVKFHYEARRITRFTDILRYNSIMWFISIFVFNNFVGISVYLIKNIYEHKQMQIAILKEKNKMELSFLRSQIQPHFLFNTLNNIYGLVIDNEKASQSILRLSDLLRFSLHESSKSDISLQEEIIFLTNYISLEKMRHKDENVSIVYDFSRIDDLLQFIKPLLLVNFIENAFKHGVNSNVYNPWVKIELIVLNGILTFYVANNIAQVKGLVQGNKEIQGLGLNNVRRRLELEYPERFSLNIKETKDLYEIELVLKL